MKNRTLLLVIFSLSLVFAPSVLGQTTPTPSPSPSPSPKVSPTPNPEDEEITVDTELVNINVRVVDRNNRPINSIPQSDFKVLEDGAPQQIEFFSKSEVPTNYSLVIDNSGSIAPQFEKVIEAGKILIAANRPADETSIIRFVSSDKIEILYDFTTDKNELNDALDNGIYKEGGQTAIIDALYLAVERLGEQAAKGVINDRTRKAIILVTDGEDRNSYYNEKQLFELLGETDVQIYIIGFVRDLETQGGFISKSPQSKAKAFLERIANTSGGKVYYPTGSDLVGIAKEISSELRMQYSIGYIPSNEKKDGTFRNIKVTVNDGPNKQKRIAITRAGRTADKDGEAPKLN